MRRTLVFLLALTLAPALPVAAAPELENFEPGIKLVPTDELKSWLDQKKDLLLVNTLSPVEFFDQAIPDSVNLPYEYVAEGKVKLPADKDKLLVFY